MAGGVAWSRRVGARTRTLRTLVKDTQRALHDVANVLSFEPEISIAVQEIGNQSLRSTALVILGTSPAARARLLHAILGRKLLPEPPPRGGRWVRIQYGSSTQVHLSLGNSEFELVEELECNRRDWDTLPVEDLLRQDQTDLTTILEVELNNQFLKDGLKIIIPPDLATDPGLIDHLTLKKHHSELYNKRNSILKNVNPIYLYGIDRMGRNIFSDTICGSITTSRSEEDFWNTFSLYYNSKVNEGPNERDTTEMVRERVLNNTRMPAVFSGENCLDLHQVKELNPNAQLLFFLFADSEDMDSNPQPCHRSEEATESTEEPYRSEELPESDQGLLKDGVHRHTEECPEQTAACTNRRLYEEQNAFMNDLLDQWEMMTSGSPKQQVRSQWAIVADVVAGGRSLDKARDDDRSLRSRTALLNTVVKFAADCVQASLLQLCTRLSEVHVRLVQQLVLASFDLARELQLVPRKIQYVATQEQHLYDTINEKFSEGDKKQELVAIMQEVLHEMKQEVINMDWSVDDLPCHQDRRFVISNSTFYNSSRSSPEGVPIRLSDCARTSDIGRTSDTTRAVRSDADASDGEEAVSYDSYNFDDYEIIRSNEESLGASECFGGQAKSDDDTRPYTSIRVENESGMVSLSSTLWTNTTNTTNIANSTTSVATCTNTLTLSFKQASLDVQQTVLSKLSRKISVKLVKFMDCLKDTYFGTLQRCLESLEEACLSSLGGRAASEAARSVRGAARHVDLQPCASVSLLRELLHSLRRLLHRSSNYIPPHAPFCSLGGRAAPSVRGAARHVDLQPCASVSLLRELLHSLRRLLHRSSNYIPPHAPFCSLGGRAAPSVRGAARHVDLQPCASVSLLRELLHSLRRLLHRSSNYIPPHAPFCSLGGRAAPSVRGAARHVDLQPCASVSLLRELLHSLRRLLHRSSNYIPPHAPFCSLGGRAAPSVRGAARHVDLQPCASVSLLRELLHSLRRLLHRSSNYIPPHAPFCSLGGRAAPSVRGAARHVDLQPCASVSLLRELLHSLRRLLHRSSNYIPPHAPFCSLGGRAAPSVRGAARHVDLQPCASVSLLRELLHSLRRLLHRLRLVRGETEQACCVLSPVWRRRVALQTVHSLSPQRLARVISTQILERLSLAHEKYQSALSSLETALAGKLHHTEDTKLAIRKKYAPSFARLCLESTSMCDLLMYGTPELGREIGRGQYGVVYAARGGWAGHSPVAVKSVLPADDRHYHELAMEFFYTRSIPAHPRVVRLYGSVVQRSAQGPAVLLVSARRARDLHAAVRAGLALHKRMRVALDIVQGIRYLHSLGLVHRDIKMKNVLLDGVDRAALSDLGFCAAEALMSGSLVGTPVHMAPDLLAGDYDASVDVYAFGILFWYVCAGNVKLPSAFEAFQNKEQLWSKVKRGLRPERLPHFSDECWEVMEACWASEPSQRAHLGDIQPKLERILQQALDDEAKSEPHPSRNKDSDNSEDESLEMTGIDKDL